MKFGTQVFKGFIYLSLYNTGLYNEIQAVVPSCCTQKKPQTNKKGWNKKKDELRSFTAWGKKLIWSLVVRQRTLLYRLPDGSRVSRLWLRWVLSFSSLWALRRPSPHSLMLGRWVPMMFWAVLITRCRALLSWAVTNPCHYCHYSRSCPPEDEWKRMFSAN